MARPAIAPRPFDVLAVSAVAALCAILLSCGGGGGGGPAGGTASVDVFNEGLVDADGIADGDCSGVGGGANPYDIVSVTYALVSPIGPPVTVPFNPPIPPGGMSPIPGGLAPGTYAFHVTYSITGAQETDQCPADTVNLQPGVTTGIHFEY